MMAGFLVLAIACFVFWLVFLKLKLLRMTPGWVFGFSVVVLHLFLIFVIGLRFVTPQSANAIIVQHTIQLIPRLSEPTLVTAVLVEDNTDVKKDQPLFQFDRTVYEARVAQLEAERAAAKQNVDILKANVEAARGAVARAGADLDYAEHQVKIYERLAREDSTRLDDVTLWGDKVSEAQGAEAEDEGKLAVAELSYESNIRGLGWPGSIRSEAGIKNERSGTIKQAIDGGFGSRDRCDEGAASSAGMLVDAASQKELRLTNQ